MGLVIDFEKFKNRKLVHKRYTVPKKEAYCPFCHAPTLITKTVAGTDSHKFDPNNMEAYTKLKILLTDIINYFKDPDKGVSDDDLIEAFGEGMQDFLRELNDDGD